MVADGRSTVLVKQPTRYHHHATAYPRRLRRDETLFLQLVHAPLLSLGEILSPALCILPAEPRFLACLLLLLEFKGARIPIVDFFLEPSANLLLDLLYLRDPPRLDFGYVTLRQFDCGKPDRGFFQVRSEPTFVELTAYCGNLFRSGGS